MPAGAQLPPTSRNNCVWYRVEDFASLWVRILGGPDTVNEFARFLDMDGAEAAFAVDAAGQRVHTEDRWYKVMVRGSLTFLRRELFPQGYPNVPGDRPPTVAEAQASRDKWVAELCR